MSDTSYKNNLRQPSNNTTRLSSNISVTQNLDLSFYRRANKKIKPTSSKQYLRQINPENPNTKVPYSQQLREQYIRNGVFTNAHKKFLNLVGNQTVKNTCKTCSKSISGLTL